MSRSLVLALAFYLFATILCLIAVSMAISTLTTVFAHFRLLP